MERAYDTFRRVIRTEKEETRAAKLERISSRFGARTKVTLADGYAIEFLGRLGKGEAVRNALWQRAKG